jgi:hypothetical protein
VYYFYIIPQPRRVLHKVSIELFHSHLWKSARYETRVARWDIFKPKIPILVNLGGSCNGSCWCIILPVGLFYDYFVYFAFIWSILRLYGLFFPVLVCCTKKNMATLYETLTPIKARHFKMTDLSKQKCQLLHKSHQLYMYLWEFIMYNM